MNDKKLIIAGLAVFCVLAILPFILSFGKTAPAPEPELTEIAKTELDGSCVLPKAEMKVEHMKILDIWRESVVRQGKRIYESNGNDFTMSLSSHKGKDSCLGCHYNKAQFCDKCHNYASVRPYCWDCHLERPEEE